MALPLNEHALSEDKETVRRFFNQWESYRKVVTHNYLYHREAYSALHSLLETRNKPFTFLDLACGDSSCSIAALQNLPVASYTGVDFSTEALKLAENNITALPCPARLVEADFVKFGGETTEEWDVIFIGLSFHHLRGAEKPAFAQTVCPRVCKGGWWIVYEPTTAEGETREECIARWWQDAQDRWTANTSEELHSFYGHISQYDFPEPIDRYREIGLNAGFSDCRVLFNDPRSYCAVMAFQK